MARVLSQLKPDVVHTHNPSPMFCAVPAAKMLGIRRLIHTKHGANIYGAKSLWGARVLVRALSALVCVSEGTAEVARHKELAPPRLVHVIPNGIPLKDFQPNPEARARVRDQLGIPQDARVVGSVGRLATEKNYPLLVKAMVPLLDERTRLLLVGGGPSEREIRDAIPESARPFVSLMGVQRDVPACMAAMDVFSLTSTTEGLPLVIPEALSMGIPVVVTAVGGLPSIVTPEVGLLRPSGDNEGLTEAFKLLLDDATRREAMAVAARAYAQERFSIESMTDAYLALYT
jgi:glycosyltransferase involved in cell wall biosynthesis